MQVNTGKLTLMTHPTGCPQVAQSYIIKNNIGFCSDLSTDSIE